MEGAFNIHEFADAKKQRNDDITFEDFDTPSCLHVIRNCAIFDEFWKNGSVEKAVLINQVIYIRNKLMHSNLKINEVHSKLAIQIILHLCKSFMIEGFRNEDSLDLSNLEHSYSSIGLVSVKEETQNRESSEPISRSRSKPVLINTFRPNLQASKYIRDPSESIKLIETILKRYDHVDTAIVKMEKSSPKVKKLNLDVQAESLPTKSKSNITWTNYQRSKKRRQAGVYLKQTKFITKK